MIRGAGKRSGRSTVRANVERCQAILLLIWRSLHCVATLRRMAAPSMLILFWCGLAATVTAAIVGALLGPRTPTAWALLPDLSGWKAFGTSMLVGTAVYPLLYGLVFEVFHRADIGIGVLLGIAHASTTLVIGRPRQRPRLALRIAAMHLTYGLTLALLYVTP